MKRIVVLLLVALAACGSPEKIPSDIMDYDKMKFIIWDLINAGEYAKMQVPVDSIKQLESKSEVYFLEIFQKHDVSREEFYKSYRYYESHPDKNKILMDSVSNYAQRKRAMEYNSIKRID